ncbi:MAG: hypothetical protein RMK57_02955 [Bryobacterales bacterium]|nr:hypothetical protein [Bryobacteraceae bacterium]MDW8353467.1 hypothetical protein [Bryobacterales bacterium]
MRDHVRILGILYLVFGGLGLLAALLILLLFGGVAGLVGVFSQEPEARVAIPVLGVIGAALFLLLVLLSVPGLIAGAGLLKFRPWARLLAIVLSAINLLNVPFGTALGVYGLWVLFQRETEALFVARV